MKLKKVEVISDYLGLTCMQVCVIPDVTDEEILRVCNKENPSGTTGGWNRVIRDLSHATWTVEGSLPGRCLEFPERVHYLVTC